MDVFSKKKRSTIMSAVRGHGNDATEIRLISILRENGVTGWRRNYPLFGHPDFVFPRARVAVFVDGCFWHKCPLHGSIPKTNKAFWTEKLRRNVKRDREVASVLRKKGWLVARVWQHELRQPNSVVRKVGRLLSRTSSPD